MLLDIRKKQIKKEKGKRLEKGGIMKFSVYGTITLGKGERTFVKVLEAPSEKAARDIAYSLFGSSNGLNRKKVKIQKVEKA